MTFERNIVQKLFAVRREEEIKSLKKLRESKFTYNGRTFSSAFGRYSVDGKRIRPEDYRHARELADALNTKSAKPPQSSNKEQPTIVKVYKSFEIPSYKDAKDTKIYKSFIKDELKKLYSNKNYLYTKYTLSNPKKLNNFIGSVTRKARLAVKKSNIYSKNISDKMDILHMPEDKLADLKSKGDISIGKVQRAYNMAYHEGLDKPYIDTNSDGGEEGENQRKNVIKLMKEQGQKSFYVSSGWSSSSKDIFGYQELGCEINLRKVVLDKYTYGDTDEFSDDEKAILPPDFGKPEIVAEITIP